jgi:hypothetical protein
MGTQGADRYTYGSRRTEMTRFIALLVTVALAGCAPDPQLVEVLAAAPDSSGALGERGPYGAAWVRRQLSASGGRRVSADVFVPVDVEDSGPFPPVVFLQGGLVPLPRYAWLGEHFASRGFVVVSPEHPFDLAILAGENGRVALDGLRDASADPRDALAGLVADAPALAIGHSLGGVLAADLWLTSDSSEVRHLALLASEPNPDSDVEAREDGQVVSVTGSRDERLTPAEARAGALRFAAPFVVASVEGMNHFQFTDDPTDGELETDGVATRDAVDSRRLALFLVDALAADLSEPAAAFELPSEWPDGLSPVD